MKRFALTLALALLPTIAWGQCSGIFPDNTVCGNATGGATVPRPTASSSFPVNVANPTAEVGLTAINGVATTAMRSDAAPALSQAIVPTWTGTHTFNGGATVFGTVPSFPSQSDDAIFAGPASGGPSIPAFRAFTSFPAFTGDSGAGGAKGLVPAPAAGDAAINKVLRSDGTWNAAANTAVFNVLDYGADDTAATDSTTAIQAAIDAAAAYTSSPSYGPFDASATVYFPPGIYSISSLNVTGVAAIRLFAVPSSVILYADQQASAEPVIDMTKTSSSEVYGLTVAGQTPAGADPSVLPTVGFLLAETTAGGDSNKNRIVFSGTLGKFANYAIMVFGSTDNVFDFNAFQQDNANAPVLFVGITNTGGVTSPYQTIATAPTNVGDNTFLQNEFHGHRSSSATAPTTVLAGADNIRFYGGNHDNSGPAQVRFEGANKQILFSGVKFYSESGHPSEDMFFSANAGVINLGIVNINTEDNAFSDNFIDGSGTPDFTGGWIAGVKSESLVGPFLHFFAEPFPIVGGPAVNLAGNTTKYLVMGGSDTNEANARMPIVRKMVINNMRVKTGGSPGAGESYVITVRKNGVATTITATVSDGGTTAEDLTNAVVFDVGNEISIEANPSTTANNTGSIYVSLGQIP